MEGGRRLRHSVANGQFIRNPILSSNFRDSILFVIPVAECTHVTMVFSSAYLTCVPHYFPNILHISKESSTTGSFNFWHFLTYFTRSPQLGSFINVSGGSHSAQRSYDTSLHQSKWTSRHRYRPSLCSGGTLANNNGPGMCSCIQQLALGTVVCSVQKKCHSAWTRNDWS